MKTLPNILYEDGKFWLVEVPEKPEFKKGRMTQHEFRQKLKFFYSAYDEAIKNKLEIVNPDVALDRKMIILTLNDKGERCGKALKEGELYQWPGIYSMLESLPPKIELSLPEQGHEEKETEPKSGEIYYCDEGDPHCVYPKCVCNTPKPEPVQTEEKSEAKRLLDLFFENRPDEDRRYSEVVILELMEAYRRKPVLHDDQDQEAMIGEIISECRVYDGTPTYFLMITRRIKERFTITRKSL